MNLKYLAKQKSGVPVHKEHNPDETQKREITIEPRFYQPVDPAYIALFNGD